LLALRSGRKVMATEEVAHSLIGQPTNGTSGPG
jgi:hypothetical protein